MKCVNGCLIDQGVRPSQTHLPVKCQYERESNISKAQSNSPARGGTFLWAPPQRP